MKKYFGFSLVELLTALAISTLIVLGVGQAFISQKVSYQAQNGLSRVQQTGRFAVEFIGNEIRMSGFPGRAEQASATFDSILNALTIEGGGSNSDTLAVMYQTTRDCLNALPPSYPDGNRYAKNQYSIVNGNLVCSTFDAANTQLDSQILARGIQNMQVLYGLGSQYVPASSLTIGDWEFITSARVSFLVNSVDIANDFTDANTYVLLNADPIGPFNDNLRRRVFTTTALIRNRMDMESS